MLNIVPLRDRLCCVNGIGTCLFQGVHSHQQTNIQTAVEAYDYDDSKQPSEGWGVMSSAL